MREELEEKSGFTLRSYLAIVYAIVVFMPAIVYMYLTTFFVSLIGGVMWTTVILFSEFSRMFGKPLTKQEAGTIFVGVTVTNVFLQPLLLLYQLYFRHSPITSSFGMMGYVPEFYSPSSVFPWKTRTFFDPAWYLPLFLFTINLVCILVSNITLGLLARELFIEKEKLDFPAMRIGAEACITLTERQPDRLRVFGFATFVGIIYSFILYTIPFIARSIGYEFAAIPIPWLDWNFYIHRVFPGASLGLATELVTITMGWIIPFNAVVSMFIGSFAIYFIGNFILIEMGITKFAEEWRFGMDISTSWQRSLLYSWVSPILGMLIAAGVLPILRYRHFFVDAMRSMMGAKGEVKPVVPLWVLMGGFVAAGGISIFINHMLVPDFPIWVLALLALGWNFVYVLVCSRAAGEVGVTFDFSIGNVPYLNQIVYGATGYRGYDIYFAPLIMETSGGAPSFVQNFRVMQLTNTTPLSFVKIWLASIPLAFLVGFIYVANFWRMAPIPSAVYRGTEIAWPVTAIFQNLLITRSVTAFRPLWLIGGFVITSALYLVFDFTKIPVSMIAISAGAMTPLPNALGMFVGAIVGKVAPRFLGREWWQKYNVMITAGFTMGLGMAVVVGSAAAMIVKSMWFTPF